GADGRFLQVVDDGGATGNRPLSYTFELSGIDLSPAGTAKVRRQPPRPSRRRMRLQEALDRAGLRYDQYDEQFLVPPILEALVLGLLELGLTKRDLLKPRRWRSFVERCARAQASRIRLHVDRAEAEIRDLARAAKLTVRPNQEGSLMVESRFARTHRDLLVRV